MPQSLDLFPIGNCAASGLIDRAGRLVWACAPRVDGDPMFSSLLGPDPDAERRLAAAYFLAACSAPAQPTLREEGTISTEAIRSSIVALGHHLLGSAA